MASLRDIKNQISSVKSTQQITSAMQMVSTVKLQRAQRIISRFRPYQEKISELMNNFLKYEEATSSIYEEVRNVEKVAIMVFSGNMNLCGSYNANVAKKLDATLQDYNHLKKENIKIYAIGEKIAHATRKLGFKPTFESLELANSPNYEEAIKIADDLMKQFRNKEIDQLIIIYHHFKTKGSQILTRKTVLPITFEQSKTNDREPYINYIVEPDKETIQAKLIPQVIRLKIYAALLNSHTSEHAARSIAMQGATDNADDLLGELSLKYNKLRQESITNELLDIIGATFK